MFDSQLEQCKKIISGRKKVRYAILFGSALGKLRRDSDIDLLLGGRLSFWEKVEIMNDLEKVFQRKIDVVVAQDASCELVMEAMSKGRVLFSKDDVYLKKDYFKNFYAYEDSQNLRQLKMCRIKKEYQHGS